MQPAPTDCICTNASTSFVSPLCPSDTRYGRRDPDATPPSEMVVLFCFKLLPLQLSRSPRFPGGWNPCSRQRSSAEALPSMYPRWSSAASSVPMSRWSARRGRPPRLPRRRRARAAAPFGDEPVALGLASARREPRSASAVSLTLDVGQLLELRRGDRLSRCSCAPPADLAALQRQQLLLRSPRRRVIISRGDASCKLERISIFKINVYSRMLFNSFETRGQLFNPSGPCQKPICF